MCFFTAWVFSFLPFEYDDLPRLSFHVVFLSVIISGSYSWPPPLDCDLFKDRVHAFFVFESSVVPCPINAFGVELNVTEV